MKKELLALIALVSILVFSSSCTKNITEIKIVKDTLIVRTVDTLVTNSKDTTFTMDVNSWNFYSYNTFTSASPGPSTYFSTEEGIRFLGQAFRRGSRLQTKKEVGFKDKKIYFKWKGFGGGQFAAFVAQVKYDPLSNDGIPSIQGVDFTNISVGNSYNSSVVVSENVWYYTTIRSIIGTDNFEVTTASGNYATKGGMVIQSNIVPVYTKSGYLSIRMGDNFAGTNSYGILAECKISTN